MNKIISLSIILCSPLLSFADTLYFGAGGGYQSLHGKLEVNNPLLSTHARLSGEGGVIQLLLGYGIDVNEHFWLGLEVNGEPTTAKINLSILGLQNEARALGGGGIGIKPGYKFNDQTKAYLALGYQVTRFNGTLLNQDLGGAWIDAVRYGVGFQTNINHRLALRAEVLQSRYRSYKGFIRPVTNQALLGLIWQFDIPSYS
ncbi:MAG: outer membrane beta-barrel protein [Legionellales bacterium]|nr:outer membrane beta-barrel protein [Legionellales bacterium]